MSKLICDHKAITSAIISLYADTGETPGPAPGHFIRLEEDVNKYWTGAAVRSSNSHPPQLITVNCGMGSAIGPCTGQDWSAWNGPYIDKLEPYTPWKGLYALYKSDENEINSVFFPDCYPNFADNSCPVPEKIAGLIDEKVDNGNLSSGDFQFSISGHLGGPVAWKEYSWSMIK